MLQYVAECFRVLQYIQVCQANQKNCCSVFAVFFAVVYVMCRVAECIRLLQCILVYRRNEKNFCSVFAICLQLYLECVAVCCNVYPCVAVHTVVLEKLQTV